MSNICIFTVELQLKVQLKLAPNVPRIFQSGPIVMCLPDPCEREFVWPGAEESKMMHVPHDCKNSSSFAN